MSDDDLKDIPWWARWFWIGLAQNVKALEAAHRPREQREPPQTPTTKSGEGE